MLVGVYEIKVGPRFATPDMERVKTLASSMKTLGLLCPIAVDEEYNLISGLSRLEAAKLMGWPEIECEVQIPSVLQTELAELDAILLRKNLSELNRCDLLLRRKEIYDALHSEPRQYRGGKSAARANKIDAPDAGKQRVKPFAPDNAKKCEISRRTLERKIRIDRNLTPEAKEILWDIAREIPYATVLMISDLSPGQQRQAALLLVKNGAKMDRNLLMSSLSSP